jgi:hypothetical protein
MEAAVETNHEVDATGLEANPKEKEAVAEHPEVPYEQAALEIIGALGDRHLAVGYRRQPTKRTHGDGGSRQKSVAAPGLWTSRSRSIPGKTPGNGIRGRSRRQQLRLESKGTFYEALGRITGLEVKRAVGFSIGLLKVRDWTLWSSWPPSKRKERVLAG